MVVQIQRDSVTTALCDYTLIVTFPATLLHSSHLFMLLLPRLTLIGEHGGYPRLPEIQRRPIIGNRILMGERFRARTKGLFALGVCVAC